MLRPTTQKSNFAHTDYAVAVQKWCVSHDFYAVSEKFLKKSKKIRLFQKNAYALKHFL
uniref:Uncharacterized protein n=1 Tax=viral metagenome TaxID=1070528 RepID=A0A6C0I288_9ZZZZ